MITSASSSSSSSASNHHTLLLGDTEVVTPCKKRRHTQLEVTLVDLPSMVLLNILSRLPLDDIFINCFLACKYFSKLIIDFIQQDPHYFTHLYRLNSPPRYFFLHRSLGKGFGVLSYIGQLRKITQIERMQLPVLDYNNTEYLFDSTRFTRQKVLSPIKKVERRDIIVSCNGIICLRLAEPAILITNPIYSVDDDIHINEPPIEPTNLSMPQKGSSMGFGCTVSNSNKFKVLFIKSYCCSCDYERTITPPRGSVRIGIDNDVCVKARAYIMTIGIDLEWRALPDQDCWFSCCHSQTLVTFRGTFFWIGHCPKSFLASSKCVCVAFDIEEEKARAIELPPEFGHIDDYLGGLVVLGDDICLYDNITNNDHVFIWKMMETTKGGAISNFWTKEFVLDKHMRMPLHRPRTFCRGLYVPIAKMPTGEILMFMRRFKYSFLYDPNTTTSYFIGASDASVGDQALPYTPNFAKLKDVMKKGIGKDS